MSQLSKLIASLLFFASIFSLTISSTAANNNSPNSNKPATSQVIETKKVLKKKLSLDYTNPKFESDLTKDQKDAILTALKKWKGELPVDNAFTVTSIASLKTDTTDVNSKVKKLKKETPNAQVVYMWARSANPNWPKDRIPTGEESEEGDPRFIRTEFNVLLKQAKNGKYKASIERDAEVKTESLDISENSLDDKIYQDLFATDKADNGFTAKTDILVDPSSSSESSISSSSQFSSISNTSSSQISSTIVSSDLTDISSSVSIVSNTSIQTNSSTTKIGFLEDLFSFGSIKVSAQSNSYSWPWKNGDSWIISQGWHECDTKTSQNSYNTLNLYGCSLDLAPYGTTTDDVLSPISGNITRVCNDGIQGNLKIGNFSITHLQNSPIITNGTVSVTKSQFIGKAFTPPASPRDLNGDFKSNCGTTNGKHIHLKIASIVNGNSTFLIDGITLSGNTNYNPVGNSYQFFTSQNTPPSLPITDNSITTVMPPQAAWQWAMDNRCGATDVTQVVMKLRDNGNCQKMRYNSGNNTITNAYGKCLDAGNVNSSSDNWLRFSNCHYGSNQKWKQQAQNLGGQIWSFEKNSNNQNMCIQYQSLTDQYGLNVVACDSNNQNQKWYPDVGITNQTIPTNTPTTNYKMIKSYYNSGYGFNIYGGGNADETPIKMFTLSGTDNELWYYNPSTLEIKSKMGKCVDAWDTNNPNNRWIRIQTCNGGNNQKFTLDSSARIHSVSNSGLCIDSANGDSQNSTLYMNTCTNGNNQKWQLN